MSNLLQRTSAGLALALAVATGAAVAQPKKEAAQPKCDTGVVGDVAKQTGGQVVTDATKAGAKAATDAAKGAAKDALGKYGSVLGNAAGTFFSGLGKAGTTAGKDTVKAGVEAAAGCGDAKKPEAPAQAASAASAPAPAASASTATDDLKKAGAAITGAADKAGDKVKEGFKWLKSLPAASAPTTGEGGPQ